MLAQASPPGQRRAPLGYTGRPLQDRQQTLGDGRYEVRRELGRGTMGVVYEAEDTLLGRTVAVKTIDLALTAGQGARTEFEQRFFTEARVAARLSHPGIVVCHDFGKDRASGQLFIVFEYLKGQTLADRVADGPLDWRDALDFVVQAARAIHHTHARGVVHRDLKPSNIMLLAPATAGASPVGAKAAVKIMDFGVARFETPERRLTRDGQSFGSPLYMSPEQALGLPSGARSDIFSLGSVLCTLLLGRPWFAAGSVPGVVRRILHDDPPQLSRLRPELPAPLDAVVARALARREDDRYATAADMAEDLEDVLAGRTPRRAAQDALLADLATPLGRSRESPPPDPLASLLDEAPAAGMPSPPRRQPTAAETSTLATGASRRRRVVVFSALVATLLATALVAWRRSLVREPEPLQSGSRVSEGPPATATTSPVPAASATSVELAPTGAPAVPTRVPTAGPGGQAGTPAPAEETPPASASEAGQPPGVATSPREAVQSRLRLSLEHPFETGRLIVWIDGVLVHETKLHASGSRRVVGIKVREGHAEKLLEIGPGPHEVRVEVTWDQGRRASTKVVDVAPRSTGLLEIRVGRLSKDLSLSWSRLARD